MNVGFVRQAFSTLGAWFAVSLVLSACEGSDAPAVSAIEMPLAAAVVPTEVASDGLAADRTAVNAGVDATGGAQVSVPIWSPEGRLGIQPNLALQYSSRGGNGILGVGWSLSGLSQISRCAKTVAQDGTAQKIEYTATDRFCLNGERLVAVSGTYGAADAVYATERDSYVKIATPQVDANGPTTFVLYAKDGSILTFGETSLYATLNGSNGARLTWHLSRVADRSGNYMTVRYNSNESGDNLRSPAEIKYTGNSASTLAPNRSITFTYDPRPDSLDAYVSGLPIRTTKRLSGIFVYGPSPTAQGLLRSYRLAYRNDSLTERSILKSIQECDANSVCKPSTTFGYTTPSVDFEERSTGLLYWPADSYWVGDINGDGRDDLMSFGADVGYNFWIASSSGTFGAYSPAGIPVLPPPSGLPPVRCAQDIAKYGMLVDLNRDGRSEFIRSKCVDNRPWYAREIFSFDSGKGRFVPMGNEAQLEQNATPQDVQNSQQTLRYTNTPTVLLTEDTNANLSIGFQAFVRDERPTYVTQNQQVAFRSLGSASYAFAASNFIAINKTMSYGDMGKPFGRKDGNAGAYCDPGGCTNLPILPSVIENGDPVNWFPERLNLFDANGDGLPDATYEEKPSQVWINKGNRQFERRDWGTAIQDQSGVDDKWANFDIDGDGLTDRIRLNPQGDALFEYVKSKNGKFEPRSLARFIAKPLRVMDSNGDGLEDILGVAASGYLAVNVRRGTKGDLLSIVTDGFGKTHQFTYLPSNAASVPTSPLSPPLPPVPSGQQRLLHGPMVVSTYKEQTARSYSRTYTYQYADPRVDLRGYGFLGFSKVVKSEASTRTTITATYDLTPAPSYPLRGKPSSETVSAMTDASGTTLQAGTDTTRTMQYQFSGSPTQIQKLATLTTTDRWTKGSLSRVLRVAEITETKNYDAYGNVTSQQATTKHSPEGGPTPTLKKTSSASGTFTFSNDRATWQIGKLLSSTETSTGENGSQGTRKKVFSYDSLGRLQTTTEAPGTFDALTVTYVRDPRALGLVTRIEQKDSGPKVRIVNIDYDPSDFMYPRFKEGVVNVQGVTTPHRTQLSYHSGLGVLTSQTDPNGVVTSWSHDGFGRLRAEVSPIGAHKEIHYRRGTIGALAVETAIAGGDRVTIESDIMGREVLRQSMGFDGRVIVNEKVYGALGQLGTVMVPRYAGEVQVPIVFESDWLGRTTRRTAPDGTSRSYTYQTSTQSDSIVTETDEVGRTTETTTDPLGQTYQSRKGGILTYKTFGPFGQVSKVSRNGFFQYSSKSSVTAFEYDSRGRLVAVVDPDTGRHETQYNGFGEVTRESTVANNTWTHLAQYDRDEFGRPTWINSPQGGTRLSWDRAGALGKLDWERSPDGILTWYGYTPAGALEQRIWTDAAGKSYAFRSTYDAFGRVSNVQYPSTANNPFAVNYRYNAQGFLAGIFDNAPTPKAYWQINSRDARGALTSETFPDSESARSYDAIGRLKTVRTKLLAEASPNVQDLAYVYWPDGNLKLRDDYKKATHEMFEYDANDRLAKWSLTPMVAGQPSHNETYGYDELGSLSTITSDSETKQYEYAVGKTHTVARVRVGGSTITYGYNDRGVQTSRATTPTASTNDRTVQYTAFDLPSSITTSSGTERFEYDGKHARFRKTFANGDEIVSAGSYEKRKVGGVTTHVYTLEALGRAIGEVFWTEGTGGAITQKRVSYLHNDLISSADALTDGQSATTRHSYRPFGKPLADPGLSTDFSPRVVTKGFGGHEHDVEVGLINMGGRVYDPELAQFLTPDPFVANALDGEAYNPYRYARHNPFKFVDPSGFVEVPITSGSGGSGVSGGSPFSTFAARRAHNINVHPTPGVDYGPNASQVLFGENQLMGSDGFLDQSGLSSLSPFAVQGTFIVTVWNCAVGLSRADDKITAGLKESGDIIQDLLTGKTEKAEKVVAAIREAYAKQGLVGIAKQPIQQMLQHFVEAGKARARGDAETYCREIALGVFDEVMLLTSMKAAAEGAQSLANKIAAAETGAIFGANTVGAAQVRILQRGGNTINRATANALNEASGLDLVPREWGRALEALKKSEGLPNNFHGAIDSTGNLLHPQTGDIIGNMHDFLP